MDLNSLYLALVAFAAAVSNGAIGYGFSSTITPIAVLWYSNKVLNPALVIVEVGVNLVLLYRERSFIAATWKHARTIVTTMFPGVVVGAFGLAFLAVNDVKIVLYAAMLPLTIFQLIGIRRPVKNERRGGLLIGPGIGFLYSLTTISGPPLALFFRNQGLSKNEFRCTIAQVRVAESTLTLTTYLALTEFLGANLVAAPSLSLLPYLFLPVLIGVPLGTVLLQSVSRDFFSRFVMGVDGLLVSYGLSRTLVVLKWINTNTSYLLMAVFFATVAVFTAWAINKLPRFWASEEEERPGEAGEPLVPGVS